MSQPESNSLQPSPGYEVRDIKVRPLVWLAVSIAACAAIVQVALWFYLHALNHQELRAEGLVSPRANQRQLPPAPRLQEAPLNDYQQLREAEEKALTTYGWIDRNQGVVRVPIERAIELLIERGESRGPEKQSQEQNRP